MAPKKNSKKRSPTVSPLSNLGASMKLRLGCIPNRTIDQSIITHPTFGHSSKKKETNVHDNEDKSEDSDQDGDGGAEEKTHLKHLGKQVSLGLMKDVLSQFYVKKKTLPPPLSLCRLVVHEAVRFARDDIEWLISSFDTASYLETMGHFLVSVADSRGDTMPMTAIDFIEGMSVPKWNTFLRGLVIGCMDLAREFLANEGFLVTMCVAEHIGDFIAEASRVGFFSLCTWTLMCNQMAYPLTREVLDLTMCLWYRAGHPVPRYDREAGENIAGRMFPADYSHMMDDCVSPTDIDGVIAKVVTGYIYKAPQLCFGRVCGVWWSGPSFCGGYEALHVSTAR